MSHCNPAALMAASPPASGTGLSPGRVMVLVRLWARLAVMDDGPVARWVGVGREALRMEGEIEGESMKEGNLPKSWQGKKHTVVDAWVFQIRTRNQYLAMFAELDGDLPKTPVISVVNVRRLMREADSKRPLCGQNDF